MRIFIFPALLVFSLGLAAAAWAADQSYAYGGLTLGMTSEDVTKVLGDSTPDNTDMSWMVEGDLGIMMYEGENSKSLLAMYDQNKTVLLMVMETLKKEAYDGLYASYRSSFGEPTAAPPDFAMKHEIFADFNAEDQAGLDTHFWGDPETQQVLATGYDPETSGFYLLLVDIDDSMKSSARMDALAPPETTDEAPPAEAPPADEVPPAEGETPPAPEG